MNAILAAETTSVGVVSGDASAAWLLIALPAFGALVLFLAGRRADRWGHWVGVGSVVAAFLVGLAVFVDTVGLPAEQRTRELSIYDWISVAGLNVDFGLRVDPLSLTFVLLITGVGSLIHLYSVGYMSHDPGRRRFFAQLNLFVAAMLMLVLGNNFVVLYLGWEGVGLASYLLIGWYQDRPSAATAAKKAFLMNRVGDVGLAIAIFIILDPAGHRCSTPRCSPGSARSAAARWWRSPCCCCSARAASPASSRCSPGCPTRWRARPRSRR